MYVYTPQARSACRGQNRALNPLELEWQTVVSRDSNLGPLKSALHCWVFPTLLKLKHPNTVYSKYKLNTNFHAKESRETFRAFAVINLTWF